MSHDDALVVTMTVAIHAIHQILVDNGSSANILYWPAFKQMGIDQDRIKPVLLSWDLAENRSNL
jgi:hypothetical protein